MVPRLDFDYPANDVSAVYSCMTVTVMMKSHIGDQFLKYFGWKFILKKLVS